MKLRLILKTKTKKNKDVVLKFSIAPSKHIGFINFINLCLNQDNPVSISFEKISTSSEIEESKIAGSFKFEAKDKNELKNLEEELKRTERKKKK
ncbi:MAG: hypothetical protein KGD57_07410 [Candidatus Lokiarchaeota archaeon]|nr:hypothetical protein [Candidatus Lokiarchaeota archaeon]